MSGLCAIIGYSKEWDILSSKLKFAILANLLLWITGLIVNFPFFSFRSELFTATITEFACVTVWLLALMSVNFQRLELHYCYHIASLLTAILVAYLVCHEGNKVKF